MLRDTVVAEGQRRAHAERVAAAAEHAAQAAAEDADYTRELLEQANARTPARALDPPDYAPARSRPHSRTGPGHSGVNTAAQATLQAAAEAAELLEELKGGLKVSIEHQRSLQDQRERYERAPPPPQPALAPQASERERPKYSRPASPVQRAEAAARGGGGFAGVSARDNWNKVSAHARAMSYGRKIAGSAPTSERARDPAPTARVQSPYLNPGSASGRERANSFGMGRTSPSSGFHGGGGAYSGYAPPPPQYATPALRRAKKHVALRGDDDLHEAAVAPQDMGPTALDQARREYAVDKRMALERRRQRMLAEENLPQA